MELEVAKKVFENTDAKRKKIVDKYDESYRYYNNRNDIVREKGKDTLDSEGKDDGYIRQADNRISNGYHRILVDQKAQYLGGVMPTFDTEDDALNDAALEILGDNYARIFNRLIVQASNAGTGWIHYWVNDNGEFRYATVDPDQIMPVYDESLEQSLIAVRRTYEKLDVETGDTYIHEEYWTDKEAQFFKYEKNEGYDSMVYDDRVKMVDVTTSTQMDSTSTLTHDFGRVPFIPFLNNADATPDLQRYKGLVDVFDRVYSGFVNDVDDVQQVILILTNYGEAGSADEFKQKLKQDQMINIEKYGDGDKSGLDKLTIDIPVQARDDLLDRTREAIFLHGQGVDPMKVDFGSTNSGIAIKMLYTLLELKAKALEAEFTPAVSELVRAILRYLNDGQAYKRRILQVWTRSAIKDDVEKADVIAKLADITSAESIAKNNPLVSDWQNELKLREDETGTDYYQPDETDVDIPDVDDEDEA